jgi:hypothetical protein
MWRSALARCLVWFVALAGLGFFALAQENTGNVYGRVLDDQGKGIPGATAMLTGSTAPVKTVSDTNGFFRFLRVPPGRYRLNVEMPGFSLFEQDNVIVTLGKNTEVEASLKLANVQEKVTVTSTTPLIDTRKVQTGVTFSANEMQDIPTSRDIFSLMQQVPGIQLDTVNVAGSANAEIGGPAFATKGTGNVTYLVDGATTTDNSYGAFNSGQGRQNGGTNMYFDFGTFDSVEVATGGSLLDLQQPGSTINVVTKRGTNEIRGSARYLYVSDRTQSNNTPQEAIDEGFQTNQTRFIREYGAEVGFPIIKDKLWIWGAGSRQDVSQLGVGLNPEGQPVAADVELQPWAAKINAQLAPSNALSFYYQYSSRDESGIYPGTPEFYTPETLQTLLSPTYFFKLEDNNVFSADMVLNALLTYQNPLYDLRPVGGDAQMDYYDGLYHNNWNFFITRNPQYQGNINASKFFNTGTVNHELKASFNYRRQINDSASGWPGDQVFGSQFSTYALAGITRGVHTVYKTEYYTGTLGDTLTAGNFTINAGVRYDYQRGKNLPSSAAANPMFPDLLPAVVFNGNEGWPFSYTNWQPRVSATYAIGKEKKTLARASYAMYTDQLGFVTYQMNGLPITSGFYYYWNDTNADHKVQKDEVDLASGYYSFYNVDPRTAPNPPNQVASSFKSPITNEFTFGIDHQFFDDFAVSATYTYRHVSDLQYRLPIGAGPDTWDLAGTAIGSATATNGFTINYNVPFYFLNLPDNPTGTTFLNRPGATQTFNGIDLVATKRLSNNWMARLTFGWNDNKQQIPPEAILDPNNRWNLAGQNQDGGDVVGYSAKSYLWINARWQFNVAGLYQFPWGIALAANLFGREGYPASYYVRSNQREWDNARITNLVGTIAQYRLDDVYEFDMRLEKTFNISGVNLTFSGECFNVLNNGTVLQRVGRVGDFNVNTGNFSQNDEFNHIFETQNPRIWRFGARITF